MVLLSEVFERHVLKHASLHCPDERKGRPRALSDSEALSVPLPIAFYVWSPFMHHAGIQLLP